MRKQTLVDILIVLILPVIIGLGYFFWKNDSLPFFNLSSQGPARPGLEVKEPGAKARMALDELNSISFDESLFEDPAYLSLHDFTPDITSVSLGREYPFTSPEVVRKMIEISQMNEGGTKSTSALDVSSKINLLKISSSPR